MIQITARLRAEDILTHYPNLPLSTAEFILRRIRTKLQDRVQEFANEAMQEMVANHIDDEEKEA